jgi:SAM-dependent methyltransferase
LQNKTVLEVGCGTGSYTLPLARFARQVYAIDLSPRMLALLEDSARDWELSNIRTHCASWDGVGTVERGWNRQFDLAFAAMTPALSRPEALAAWQKCSREWCAVVGWGRRRENNLWQEVYEALGIPFIVPPGILQINANLSASGCNAPIRWFEVAWTWEGAVDDAVDDLIWHLRLGGQDLADPSTETALRDRVRRLLEPHAIDGKLKHETRAEEGLMIWRVSP